MLEITIGLAVFLVVIAVPPLRRAALSLLGLIAIIGAGSATFAVVVWAIYETKPWLVADKPAVVQEAPGTAEMGTGSFETAEAELTSALASEEEQHVQDEQQRLEEEKLRIAIMAARARVILEEDTNLAAQASSFPLPAGVGERLGDIMAIRIPAWRDKEVAAVQKESIRTWLQAIGLSANETASIVTAKAWGALYDMWVTENPKAVPGGPQTVGQEVSSTQPEPELPDGAEPFSDQEPFPPSDAAQEPPPLARQTSPRQETTRPARPRRPDLPRAPPPGRRPPPQQRDVGPFGY